MDDLNEESIKLLSQLCRIEISDEEAKSLSNGLKQILNYVKQLQEVDVSHLTPYSHMEEQGISSLREDKVGELLSREEFLKNAPDHVAGMIRVPTILKQNV